jgi:hypothetical protein
VRTGVEGSVLEMEHTITSAEASGYDGDLGLTLLGGPQGTIINTKVLRAMKDGGTLLGECDGRHSGESKVREEGGVNEREGSGGH